MPEKPPRNPKGSATKGRRTNRPTKRTGRPPKDPSSPYSETVSFNVTLPKALMKDVDRFRVFAAKRRYKDISRSEAMRELMTFAILHWKHKYMHEDIDEPSLS